jgi:hypothetical protein
MPDLSNITVPQYLPNQPYHYTYDNLPIDALVQRDDLINSQVDANTNYILQSFGTAGSLANRLNQSLENNGDLKTTAVNTALHNIGAHTDGSYGGTDYVRMTLDERSKLSLIAPEAKNIAIEIDTASNILYFDNGTVVFENSSTITWSSAGGQNLRADVAVSLSNPHQHYDGIVPTSVSLTPDYQNYLTGLPTAFTAGSLKVYINGGRIFEGSTVYAPTSDPLTAWQQNSFTENVNGLGFSLLNAITSSDIIVIDFEVPLG